MEENFQIAPKAPKNESGLAQMMMMGGNPSVNNESQNKACFVDVSWMTISLGKGASYLALVRVVKMLWYISFLSRLVSWIGLNVLIFIPRPSILALQK